MPIPDFQRLMLPFLTVLKDGNQHTLSEIIEALAIQLKLTEDEKNELIPSGRQTKLRNRVGWVRTYLKKAGLIETVSRATFVITKRGIEVLKGNPSEINVNYLEQFSEFREFQNGSKQMGKDDENKSEQELTPEENMESNYLKLRRTVEQELLDLIKKYSPSFFESLVVDLLVAMGYGGSRKDAGQAIGRSGDGGVDGIIKEDKLGLDVVYIQAKRWQNNVGRPEIQSFAGSLEGFKARKGVFITTSRFTQDAKDYVDKIEKKIVLIDGEQLTQLMIDYNVGVTEEVTYTIKRVDQDYFVEE